MFMNLHWEDVPHVNNVIRHTEFNQKTSIPRLKC